MKAIDGRKAYEAWCGGLSLDDKIKTMKKVKLVQCARCKARFEATETPRERRAFKCISPEVEHVYVPCGTYLRLESDYAGYHKGLQFPEGFKYAKQAIREFFGIAIWRDRRVRQLRVIEANWRNIK